MKPAKAPPTSRRLGFGHFLVWMAGVGVVLALFQVGTDFNEMNESLALRTRLMHLSLGVAYGTAISGVGLFLWWRLRGVEMRPTQPGHWLLVVGGLALIIDL